MNLIVAGTDPLATHMVGSTHMGIRPDEVPTFACADQAGMLPTLRHRDPGDDRC